MEIGRNWKIESDELNVKLMKRRIRKATTDKPRKEYWTVEGFYGTPKEALIGLVRQGVRATGLRDIRTVVAKMDELYRLIEGIKYGE